MPARQGASSVARAKLTQATRGKKSASRSAVRLYNVSQYYIVQCQGLARVKSVLCNGVASPKFWEEPKNLGGAKMLDLRRITLFCLEKNLSKHKMTIFLKILGGSLWPLPGYAYGSLKRISTYSIVSSRIP